MVRWIAKDLACRCVGVRQGQTLNWAGGFPRVELVCGGLTLVRWLGMVHLC